MSPKPKQLQILDPKLIPPCLFAWHLSCSVLTLTIHGEPRQRSCTGQPYRVGVASNIYTYIYIFIYLFIFLWFFFLCFFSLFFCILVLVGGRGGAFQFYLYYPAQPFSIFRLLSYRRNSKIRCTISPNAIPSFLSS